VNATGRTRPSGSGVPESGEALKWHRRKSESRQGFLLLTAKSPSGRESRAGLPGRRTPPAGCSLSSSPCHFGLPVTGFVVWKST